MVAKCGGKVAWHWAHTPKRQCDPWWENETDWHREWKNRFPLAWQEVIHVDPATGEKHIADVKTDFGLTIEFQNSPMERGERDSREQFYGSLIWVINGDRFDFRLTESMPDPDTALGKELNFFHPYAFRRRSSNDDSIYFRAWERGIEQFIADASNGHKAFEWARARSVWLDAGCPVYFDLGGKDIWLLVGQFTRYLDRWKTFRSGTVRSINKSEFVETFQRRASS